ncbi:Nidogen-2 [Heterocephalus glaber]|uniref:Nidogen-2 n=1 Tax=Heterocephalus glaber TaxID=10181 RepID=G5BLP0_HETGA|nr:Nidogen-2 [Heterocephalus glaber]
MPGSRAAWPPSPSPPLLLLLLLSPTAALHLDELFPYGESRGDQLLPEGDDESSDPLQLAQPLRFLDAQFGSLYVGTNGIISTQDFPRETQYVDDDFPTDFPAIAPFLADVDTSRGRGRVLFREDTSPEVLRRAARYVRAGFPRSAASFAPTHAFLATWERVGAYEEVRRGAQPSGELNTFQAVLAYDGSDTFALFLYPARGLQFFGTRPKESYNVQLQLPARVGFCRGEAEDDMKREGPYFSLTSTEQSVKNLYQLSNLGIPGMWAFHIGSSSPLDNFQPATVGRDLPTARPWAPREHPVSHAEALERDYTEDTLDYYDENEEEVEYPPNEPGESWDGHSRVDVSFQLKADLGLRGGGVPPPDPALASPVPHPAPSDWPYYPETKSANLDPPTQEVAPLGDFESPDVEGHLQPLGQAGTRSSAISEVARDSLAPSQEGSVPHPGDRRIQPYSNGRPMPSGPNVPAAHGQGEVLPDYWVPGHIPPVSQERPVVGVEDEISSNTEVFTYNSANKETCEHNHGQCSPHAFCTDYATGFCCHCQSRFNGNGKQCLPEGTPHRVNGKVSGQLHVGHIPVYFTDVDLHAYIVGNDGRAYTAISHIPQPAAQALLPLTPIGGLFGWLFALEKPGFKNGFSLTGATFVHNMEVTFYPGEERVWITQTAEGLDPENYLIVKTNIQGQVPSIPANFTAHISPYKELYHYSDSAVTVTSSRDYSLTLGAINQTGSYRVHQNITFQACRHAGHQAVPSSQQLWVDRVFALYSADEGVLRFAVTNQIGPVNVDSEPTPVNPCYDGSHTCDAAARCHPGTGADYTCVCAPGYQGDGRSCMDVNECANGYHRCGPNSVCINLPGSYRCECPNGYEFVDDQHTCILVAPPPNPCEDSRHNCAPAGQARCINHGDGTFSCACLPGYTGNGYQCSASHFTITIRGTDMKLSFRLITYDQMLMNVRKTDVTQQLLATIHLAPSPAVANLDIMEMGFIAHLERDFEGCVEEPEPQLTNLSYNQLLERIEFCRSQFLLFLFVSPSALALEDATTGMEACEYQRHLAQAQHVYPGSRVHIPQCDEQGNFQPLQCHSSTGFCWCVDSSGNEVPGTHTPSGSTPPHCGPPPEADCCVPEFQTERWAWLSGPWDREWVFRVECGWGSVGTSLGYPTLKQTASVGRSSSPVSSLLEPHVEPTQRPRTLCERWKESLLEHYGGTPRDDQFVPQCDELGHFRPLQCHGKSDFCWCVDKDGREVQGTRSQPGITPSCIPTVAPPTVRPTPRPDVNPPSVGTFLLYAQGQQIGYLPLNGTRLQKDAARTLLSLHVKWVVGIDYDCRERMVYWTDVAGRTISRASLEPGAEPETVINSGLISPEGLAIDHFRRTMYWTDSGLDKIERARLDGSERRVLFHTDLVNPRAIAVDPIRGNLYWTDWNREAPKIETSSLDGEDRRILVNKDIGLPNGLTFDASSKLLCWADAGTKKLECTLPDGTERRVIQHNLNYPFSIVSYANHFYHTDWRSTFLLQSHAQQVFVERMQTSNMTDVRSSFLLVDDDLSGRPSHL